MTNKVIVSKSGFNALTETNTDNLVYSSDYKTLKYFSSGENTVTISSGSLAGEKVIMTHNLGYVPFFMGYLKELGREQYYSFPYTFADFSGHIYFFLYSTDTQLILGYDMSANPSDFDITVWYKVFKYKIAS